MFLIEGRLKSRISASVIKVTPLKSPFLAEKPLCLTAAQQRRNQKTPRMKTGKNSRQDNKSE